MRTKPFRTACALIGVLLLAAGCTVDPPPAAPEPFGDFAVGEFGGVDGRQHILRVGKDGVALLIAGSPAAGRLSDTDLARLRRLLISEQFRREVAREAALPKPEQACSDGAPLLVAVGLRRLPVRNQPGYLITVDQAGRGSIAEPGEPVRSVILTENQQDVLRMLEPLLSEGPVPPCNSPEHYRLHIGGGEIRPDCSFRGRYPEFRALVSLLEDAFAR